MQKYGKVWNGSSWCMLPFLKDGFIIVVLSEIVKPIFLDNLVGSMSFTRLEHFLSFARLLSVRRWYRWDCPVDETRFNGCTLALLGVLSPVLQRRFDFLHIMYSQHNLIITIF